MAGDGGLNALSLLPENVLPQWQQKIANAENTANPYCRGPNGFSARSAIFCRYWTCSFSGRNNQAIGAEVVCHFHKNINENNCYREATVNLACNGYVKSRCQSTL